MAFQVTRHTSRRTTSVVCGRLIDFHPERSIEERGHRFGLPRDEIPVAQQGQDLLFDLRSGNLHRGLHAGWVAVPRHR